ncbi:aspartate kinase [Limosilactobacillus equigenerosi]|uniref:Aspartokinase n=1 Tax=Limosilactobacillus equigenerosi DSM 18793 = JCM 14505 TaxID=1423742 RepID=A0A0R1UHV9_9LACO|nr:aspartate kinase [Limosilactobacillus equigenerosi]KRL92956.1 Aspartokinase [Limosilactobacillus equigenerosi DSM 18793 = JCM 14505]
MKVIKFGGSSLANGDAFAQAIAIIKADADRQVVVTSAPGKRFADDIKVTDLLINFAKLTINGHTATDIIAAIFGRYQAIAHHFGVQDDELSELHELLVALPQATYPNNDYLMAAFKAHGERLNAKLMAIILNHQGVPARYVDPLAAGFRVTGTPNNAVISPEAYVNLAKLDLKPNERIIFPGFYGYTLSGYIATFSRGGSDVTGAILARTFNADLYENFTDVDAIYSANPNLVPDPLPIATMTYREMRELSYAGFSVFHDEALIPAIQGQIPINVKNTWHPEKPGTMIVPEHDFQPERILTGIASGRHFAALYLHKYLLNKENGFTLRILRILNDNNVSYEHMPSGIDDLTIIFDRDKLTDEQVDAICTAVQQEINPDRLEWIDDYAIVMLVGEGMAHTPGVMMNATAPLAANGISLQMINQGASQISIMLGTRREDANQAVQLIYQQFLTDQED